MSSGRRRHVDTRNTTNYRTTALRTVDVHSNNSQKLCQARKINSEQMNEMQRRLVDWREITTLKTGSLILCENFEPNKFIYFIVCRHNVNYCLNPSDLHN